MERLALGLVLLAGTLAAGSPLHRRDLHTFTGMVLDMAPTSFDDQYRGCSRLMEEELEELNRTEFADNSIYVQAWTSAARAWWSHQGRASPSPALRPELAIALRAYTLEEHSDQVFNAAVRKAGSSREEYLDTFDFKVLHFLLSEALRTLRDAQPRRCHRVYRGVEGIRFTAQRGQTVRFGQFASTSVQEKCALSFGRDTVFSVETCYGVPISDFSAYPAEEEVLIPPFESFEVTNVTRSGDGAFIQLRSRDAHSTYNCKFVKGDVPAGRGAAGKGGAPSWGGRWGELAFGHASLHASPPLCPGVGNGGPWQHSVAQHGMAWQDMAGHGRTWHGMLWQHSMARHSMA